MKKKVLAAAACALVLVLVLTGCAPKEGTIHDKRHTAGYYYTVIIQSGKTPVPITQYAEPTWCLDLYDARQNHGWKCVSKATYNRYSIGQYYQEKK